MGLGLGVDVDVDVDVGVGFGSGCGWLPVCVEKQSPSIGLEIHTHL